MQSKLVHGFKHLHIYKIEWIEEDYRYLSTWILIVIHIGQVGISHSEIGFEYFDLMTHHWRSWQLYSLSLFTRVTIDTFYWQKVTRLRSIIFALFVLNNHLHWSLIVLEKCQGYTSFFVLKCVGLVCCVYTTYLTRRHCPDILSMIIFCFVIQYSFFFL